MLEIKLGLQKSSANPKVPAANPAGPSPEAPLTDFEQLLQGLAEADADGNAQTPEFLTIAAVVGPKDPSGTEEKKPETKTSPPETNPLLSLFGLVGVPENARPQTAPTTEQPVGAVCGRALPGFSDPEPELPTKPLLNLKDFDVRRFEFKTEIEIPVTPVPKLIRVAAMPNPLATEGPGTTPGKTGNGREGSGDLLISDPAGSETTADASPLIAAPESVTRVRVAIEPPPPPPVARQVSMDIGDANSQVHVVIRERNGELALQFGAATERLRENLQTAAPALLHQLQRDNPHAVSLDFTSFGSATDSGRNPQQDPRPKKQLKPEAVFADLDETTYLPADSPETNSF